MEVRRRFSERADGDFAIAGEPQALTSSRAEFAPHPWTWLRQVHGAEVVTVTSPGDGAGTDADASVTNVPGAVLAVQTADCVPVLLWSGGGEDSSTPVIGAAHAGWRGLYEGVIEATVAAMRSLGAGPISAAIGPCIAAPAYEFSERDLTTVALRFGPEVVAATPDGHPALDVVAAATIALRSAGVDDVDASAVACTATATGPDGSPRYFSHRARGDLGRQASVIWIEP